MKRTIKEHRRRSLLFSLLAFILVFSAVVPSSAVASSARTITVDSATKYTNVHSLNETGFEFTLKLQDDKKWANDVKDKEQLLVDGIQANQEVAKWEEYKRNHAIHIKKRSASPASDIFTNANRTELTLVFPQDAYYDLTSNQSMAIAINAALIEEWPGQVSPVNFMIYAKPQIALGGSITTDTTLGDIEIGGKVIELRLLNAQWNEEYLTRITNFNTLLDSFRDTEMPSGVWDVARALKNTDPNQVISYSEDKRTLKLTLPPVANTVTENITVTVPREFYSIEKVDVNGVLSVSGTEIPGNKISSTAVEIHIGSAAIPAMEPIEDLEESHLRTSHVPFHPLSTLTFKLKNAEWAVFTKEKKQLLLDSIQA